MDDIRSTSSINDDKEPLINKTNDREKISWVKFATILYFTVCGGAWGSERILNTYPAIALLLLMILPFFWNFMMAMISAELGLSMQNGIFQWIETAFGKGPAFITSVSYWLFYLVRSCTLYVLVLDYLAVSDKVYFSAFYWKLVPILTVAIVMAINLYGVDFLGNLSTVLLIPTLGPFVMVFILNIVRGDMNPADWIKLPPKNFFDTITDWKMFGAVFQIAVWDNAAYDSVGNTVETLKDPERNLFKSLVSCVIASTLSYILCIIAFIGITWDYESIGTGYWVLLAEALGGRPAFFITMICGMIANLAICNTLMLPISLQLCGIIDYLKIPKIGYRNAKGTPIFSIIINSAIMMILVLLPFVFLVSVSNILYSVCIILMCSAAIRIRYKFPDMKRPFKASKSMLGLVLITLGPFTISAIMLGSSVATSVYPLIGAVIFYFLLFIAYIVIERYRRKNQDLVVNKELVEDPYYY